MFDQFIGKYVVVRANEAGVIAGTVEAISADCVVLARARKVWSWTGPLSVEGLAVSGFDDGQLTCTTDLQVVSGYCQVIATTARAESRISGEKVFTGEVTASSDEK